jgi:hypothetical protein
MEPKSWNFAKPLTDSNRRELAAGTDEHELP